MKKGDVGEMGMWRKKRRRPRSRASMAVSGILGLLVLIAFTYFQLRPAVESAAAYQVNIFAARIINTAILEQLNSQEVAYRDLIRISRGANGEVVAIESDMTAINRLKANVTLSVADKLEEMGTTSLWIPLGTLIGNEITSGRGPLIEIRLYPIGYVQTDLQSQFTQAGINQTLHQIMLYSSVRMRAVIPGYTIQTEITTSYGIAETVIVGNIPDVYANIGWGEGPVMARIGEALG